MSEKPKPLEINDTQIGPSVNVNGVLWLQGALLLASFFLIFGSTMPPLYHDWRTFDTFSHGLLVPFISLYLVWQKRTQMRSLAIRSSIGGVAFIIPAVLFAVVGSAVGDSFTERVGMVLCFAGLVWTLFGTEIFKRSSFALAYLFLMIPLPYVIVKEVAYQLRIIDAALAAPALRVLGVPVYRDGYYLHLPDITLEVADLCSGISSVFTLLALGAAYVYFLPLRPRWKVVAVLSTFPFATFINLLRIVLTAALAYYVSPAVLGVLVHKLTGTVTFFIALILFIVLVEFLQRRFGQRSPAQIAAKTNQELEAAHIVEPVSRISWVSFGAAMGVMILAGYFTFNLKAQAEIHLSTSLDSLPLVVGGFQAAKEKVEGFYKDAHAELELSRKYAAPSGESIEMYVGFRGMQHGDDRLRSPKLQFPFGWNYIWIEAAQITNGNYGTVNANWMLTQNNQVRVLVLYWYQVRGQTVAREMENRLNQIRGAILERRTDGAIVRLATPVADMEKIEQAKNRLATFAGDLYPELRRVLPQ